MVAILTQRLLRYWPVVRLVIEFLRTLSATPCCIAVIHRAALNVGVGSAVPFRNPRQQTFESRSRSLAPRTSAVHCIPVAWSTQSVCGLVTGVKIEPDPLARRRGTAVAADLPVTTRISLQGWKQLLALAGWKATPGQKRPCMAAS